MAVGALPDGRIVTGSEDRSLRIWDIREGIVGNQLGFAVTSAVLSVAVDSVHHQLAAGLVDGSVLVWEIEPDASRNRGGFRHDP
jgi:WD40 repeat protein